MGMKIKKRKVLTSSDESGEDDELEIEKESKKLLKKKQKDQ